MDESSQARVCDDLFEKIKQAEDHVYELKEVYRHERMKLQKLCQHSFYRDDDGDYHSCKYFYICEKCQYVSRTKPEKFKLSLYG